MIVIPDFLNYFSIYYFDIHTDTYWC